MGKNYISRNKMNKFQPNNSEIKALHKKLLSNLQKTAVFVQSEIKKDINKKQFYDTWELINSILVSPKKDWYRVWSIKWQAVIWEFGRKAGKFPNLNWLVWRASRHGFIRWRTTDNFDTLDSKDKFILFNLGKSIKRKGIKPRRIFSDPTSDTQKIKAFYTSLGI